jgi:hypothetical protein
VTLAGELRGFRILTGVILLIPFVVGLVGAYGGLEGLAALFGEDREIVLAPALRDHLRAICWMFFALAPMIAWTLARPVERVAPFRILVGAAICAGPARIAGAIVDGNPGMIALVFAVVLIWHASLVGRLRSSAP